MTPEEAAIATLKRARDLLQSCGDQHVAKAPPQPRKAGANYDMVSEINATLLMLATEEAVRSSDILELTSDMTIPVQPPMPTHPAQQRLKAFIDTLEGRDDDSWTHYHALLGDLRALTQL